MSSQKYRSPAPQKTASGSSLSPSRRFSFNRTHSDSSTSPTSCNYLEIFFYFYILDFGCSQQVTFAILSISVEPHQEVSVDALMQRMRTLSQKQDECSESELNHRFKTVEMQVGVC